jgi:acyl carrier protein
MSSSIESRIRTVLDRHGKLNRPASELGGDADLFQAGLTSHATVNVMLALEDALGIEFPDHMLRRSVFSSVTSLREALLELTPAGS